MHDTIMMVRFTDFGQARRALRMLKLMDSEGQLRVRAAALVDRSGEVGIAGPDHGEGVFLRQRDVVGTVADALSGRAGGVFARPTEALRARGAPWSHSDERAVALEAVTRHLEPGATLVIAEVEDPDPDVLDSAADALGGSATQRSADAFYAELCRAVGR